MTLSSGARNSFVTFDTQTWVTDNACIAPPFVCYPIRFSSDLSFQMNVFAPSRIPSDPSTEVEVYTVSNNVSTQVTGVTIYGEVLTNGLYALFFEFQGSTLGNVYNDGDCFTLTILTNFDDNVLGYGSNECFTKITDPCFTTAITYYNVNEDAFGFHYFDRPVIGIPWYNKIRLPIYLKNPVINTEQEVYVRSDGTRQKLFARLFRQYQAITDIMSEKMHENLVVALNHDKIFFDNIEVTFENEYNNQFPNMMLPVSQWPADFIVYETPFDELNSNCG